jgi:cytochrome P450
MTTTAEYDPFDAEALKDPYPVWTRLRRESPVYRSPMPSDGWMVADPGNAAEVFLVTRHKDVAYALEHPEKFSSADDKNGPEVPAEVLEELASGLPLSSTLYNTDPPKHTRMRTLVQMAMSPARVAENEPTTRRTAYALADQLPRDGAELLSAYIRPFANASLLDFLGIPREDHDRVLAWNRLWEELFIPGKPPDDQRRAARQVVAYQRYYAQAVEDRQRTPRPDLLTRMAQARTGGGDRLTMAEIAWCLMELISAGAANTVDGLANVLLVLLSVPERRAAVAADRSLLPGAVEEGLRLEGPTQWLPRTAAADVELSGVPIPKGSTVMLMYQAANRDPEMYPDPDEYLPGRKNVKKHLAYGRGVHYCIGAGWSRMAIRVGIEALIDRLPGIRLDEGYEPEFYLPIPVLRCVRELPVNWSIPAGR